VTHALTIQDDPLALTSPTLRHPVVLPRWISAGNEHANSRYSEMTWSLAPLIDNPGAPLVKVNWERCPVELLEQMKLLTWTLVNGELPAAYLQARGGHGRTRLSAATMAGTVREWLRLARWLCRRGITDLAACTDDDWRSYATDRRAGGSTRQLIAKILGDLTTMWALDQLSLDPPTWLVPMRVDRFDIG
jgi:hypothetical protein